MPLLTRYDLNNPLGLEMFRFESHCPCRRGELDNYYILYGMALQAALN
jgi:hypothetical protein